eukprot:RCo034080
MRHLRALFSSKHPAVAAPLRLPTLPLLLVADFVRSHRNFCMVCRQWAEVAHQRFIGLEFNEDLQAAASTRLFEEALEIRTHLTWNLSLALRSTVLETLKGLPEDTPVTELSARLKFGEERYHCLGALKRFRSLSRVSLAAKLTEFNRRKNAELQADWFLELTEVITAPSLKHLHLDLTLGMFLPGRAMVHLLQGIPRLQVLELKTHTAPFARLSEIFTACRQATGLQQLSLDVGYTFPTSEREESPLKEPGLRWLASLPNLRLLKVALAPCGEVLQQLQALKSCPRLRVLEVWVDNVSAEGARDAGKLAEGPSSLEALKLRVDRSAGDIVLKELWKGLSKNVGKLKELHFQRCSFTVVSVPVLGRMASGLRAGAVGLVDCPGLSWCNRRCLRACGVVVEGPKRTSRRLLWHLFNRVYG